MVGSCGRSAGVLLPVECRSSSGSIAGLALTYQSPDLWRDKTAVASGVNNAAIPDNGADVQRPMRPGRWSEIPAAAGLAIAASKTSPGRSVSKAFPLQGFSAPRLSLMAIPGSFAAARLSSKRNHGDPPDH